jgi:hypothetical protein
MAGTSSEEAIILRPPSQAKTYVDYQSANVTLMPPAPSVPQPGNDPNLRTCRVNNPIQCNAIGFNRWDLKSMDLPQYSDYKAVYHGVIEKKGSAGLRVPQQRTFLDDQYYDSGCTSPYCLTKNECPNGETTQPSAAETNLFDNMFRSWDLDIGNAGPRTCTGITRGTYDSFSGWTTNADGVPRWETNAEEKEGPPICSGAGRRRFH